MKHKYVISLDGKGIDEAIKGIEEHKKWLERKTDELAQRLADKGYTVALDIMAGHIFDGETVASLKVEKLSEGHYVVKAASRALLFLEYGTGIRGGGHPEPNGYGPGTYPGQKHAFDPGGWWYPTDDPRLILATNKEGQGFGHSYGMPAAAPMYNGVKEAEMELTSLVQEVFST